MKTLVVLFLLFISAYSQAQLTNETEVGVTSANGNTKTQSYIVKQVNDYNWNMNILSFNSDI